MQHERPPPARPWFDLVTERIAVRGWSVVELTRHARVSRPTVYGWRDNPGKPQAAPVNAVADALGIPRERALRLAGIIASEPGPEPLVEPEVAEALRRHYPDEADELIAELERRRRERLSGQPGEEAS